MKKNLMILAASTMLLFAACNKEEGNGYVVNGNKITFSVGMDTPQTEDKQAYNGPDNRIFFTTGDHIYINDNSYSILPQVSDDPRYDYYTSSWSPLAKVTCESDENGSYEFIYPADVLQFRNDRYEAAFPQQIQLVNAATNNDFSAPTAVATDEHPIWPMYFNIPDLSHFNGNLRLKNACAFLCPTFQYTANWANTVLAPIASQIAGENVYYNQSTSIPAPQLRLLEGRVLSTMPLYGNAYLVPDDANPYMAMDAANLVAPADGLYNLLYGIAGTVEVTDNPNASHADQVGLIPVAPTAYPQSTVSAAGQTFKMYAHFTTTLGTQLVHMLIFTRTSDPTPQSFELYRNRVYTLFVDMRTTEDITYLDGTVDDYKQSYADNNYALVNFNGNIALIYNASASRAAIRNFISTYYH